MADHAITSLVVQGTIREERRSIRPARYVTDQFQEKGNDAELFDMKDYEIPLFTNRLDMTNDPHPDVETFGQKVEAADSLVIVTPEYNHSIPGPLKNLLDYLYPEYEDKPFSYVTVSAGGFGGVRAPAISTPLRWNSTPTLAPTFRSQGWLMSSTRTAPSSTTHTKTSSRHS